MCHVGWVIHDAAEMNAVIGFQLLDEVPAADFFALVERPGNAVADEKPNLSGREKFFFEKKNQKTIVSKC
jgi:hypothetical protein